ncbi:MAG: maleylacetoacetate isomerase [Myxococcota bacterium]|nr:maleylacetoacetate isomerase [Myxococcota bacterium]
MRLYTYFRSSASYRVRIALEWKAIPRKDVFVDLASGEQLGPAYRALNPECRVPLLVDGEIRLTQALAILEYLEEKYPEPPLLPADLAGRARVRQLALVMIADTQPLQNTGPYEFLRDPLGLDDRARYRWYQHWVSRGLGALEAQLQDDPRTGQFCHGDAATLADLAMVPQYSNARRGALDCSQWPTVSRIYEACLALPPFQRAAPEAQPDAKP